jgi:hypothetical protein
MYDNRTVSLEPSVPDFEPDPLINTLPSFMHDTNIDHFLTLVPITTFQTRANLSFNTPTTTTTITTTNTTATKPQPAHRKFCHKC